MKQTLRWSRQAIKDEGHGGGASRAGQRAGLHRVGLHRVGQRASGILVDLNDFSRLSRLLQKSQQARDTQSLSSRWRAWQGDLFGGTVAALIAIPYGMALSVAIGLSPEAGLYTSIIGGTVSGLLSKSPILISGLSATAVPILAVIVKNYGAAGALVVGFLSGLIMTLIGVLRLGRFANYLPQSIISAFTSGLGLIIVASQLKFLFDVVPARMSFELGIVDDISGVLSALAGTNSQALTTGGIVILTMLVVPRLKENIPSSLLGVLVASLAAALLGFDIKQVGELPSSFPLPHLIDFDLGLLSSFIYPALTLAGLFTVNQVLTGIVVDSVGNTNNAQQSNRELLAQGTANMVNPFFGAPPGVAMLARTVASSRAGATSRLSIIAHGSILLLFIIPLRNLISQIPIAALAAVTIMVGLQLVDWRRFTAIKRQSRADAALFILTFALVVLSDLIIGVGIGFLIAMILFIEHAAEATQLEAVESKLIDNVARETISTAAAAAAVVVVMQTYRLSGPLFFATSERVLSRLKKEVTAETLVLDLEAAGPTDSAAVDLLRKVFQMQQRRGGDLLLIGLNDRLYCLLEKNGLINEMGSHCFTLKPNAPTSVSCSEPQLVKTT